MPAATAGRKFGRIAAVVLFLAIVGAAGAEFAGLWPEPWRAAVRERWSAWLPAATSPQMPSSAHIAATEPPEVVSGEVAPDTPAADPVGSLLRLPDQTEPEESETSEDPPRRVTSRTPPRRLPDTFADEIPADGPLTLTQLEQEGVPIVDKPPRKLPVTKSDELPEAETFPETKPAGEPPAKVASPKSATARATNRPLAPIADIEDDAAKAEPLHDRASIDKAIELGDVPSALRELSKWYWRRPELREDLQARLDELAEQVFFSPRRHFHEPHVVQPGDRLQTIARKYHIPWEYLTRVNKVDAKKIRSGQKLKVVQGPFSAFISLANYELIVHLKGTYVRRYAVGVGKPGTTPVGTFDVKEKLVDPTYYGDDGVVAHDDPKNPLGERWIDIGDSYGIHGTIDAASIGRNESRGCIRLLNDDVAELYDLLSVGSQVTIHK